MISKPDRRLRAAPSCYDVERRGPAHSRTSSAYPAGAEKPRRTGLWDMRGRWGVHAGATLLRSSRVGDFHLYLTM